MLSLFMSSAYTPRKQSPTKLNVLIKVSSSGLGGGVAGSPGFRCARAIPVQRVMATRRLSTCLVFIDEFLRKRFALTRSSRAVSSKIFQTAGKNNLIRFLGGLYGSLVTIESLAP